MMLEENFLSVYDKFKVEFFRRLFSLVREREGSLSAMEAFSVEIIKELDSPTISQFADFLGISQSNATYKVNSLIKKGYIVKENSDIDRREYHLVLSEKFYRYAELLTSYELRVMEHSLFSKLTWLSVSAANRASASTSSGIAAVCFLDLILSKQSRVAIV
ncbi:MAG: MarR family transcriptional regulator [Bacteroidales bacterium]|nr:MarR family transcriptional regulator [Bacteroidales bacterium]